MPLHCSRHHIVRYKSNCQVRIRFKRYDEVETYSPDPEGLAPKLLPTTPVKVHFLPAALVQEAVAVWPTRRHVIARFSRTGEATERLARTRTTREPSMMSDSLRMIGLFFRDSC